MYKDRVIVPPTLHVEVLSTLNAADQGVSMMTARAESSVFWPGIDGSIGRHQCHSNKLRTLPRGVTFTAWSTAHPTDTGRLPLPGSVLGLFHAQGRALPRDGWQIHKLANHIAVDRWRHRLSNHLRRAFVTYGPPEELASAGGTEFTH